MSMDCQRKESHDLLRLFAFRWEEEKCRDDPTLFCRMILDDNGALCSSHPLWILADIKRSTDIEFFKERFPDRVLLVRIGTSDATHPVESERHPWSFILSDDAQIHDLINMIQS